MCIPNFPKMFLQEHQDSTNQCYLTDEEPAEPEFTKKREKTYSKKYLVNITLEYLFYQILTN